MLRAYISLESYENFFETWVEGMCLSRKDLHLLSSGIEESCQPGFIFTLQFFADDTSHFAALKVRW